MNEKLSIVIPVYYNEDNLYPLYDDLREKVLCKLECDYEIIMVNDGSKDASWKRMQELRNRDKKIKIINLSRNFGEHPATLCGLAHCTGTVAVRKAADLQEPSEMILDMYEKYKTGSKMVVAVRSDRRESAGQKFFSGMYWNIMKKFALPNIPKGGFDTYMIDRQIIDLVVRIGIKNNSLSEQLLWTGFDFDTVYYVRRKREIGKSGWTFSKKMKLAIDAFLGFSYFPIRCISVIGILSLLTAFIWIIVLVIRRITGYIDVEGYASLAILILVGIGIIMFSMGILGEYMWRMFDEVRKKPEYIVDEVIEDKEE